MDSPGLSERETFAKVGESTNDWSERSERKEVSELAGKVEILRRRDRL